ncbi:MAG: beta-propeller fold lactonase family protein [Sedimentisphaerales bacterium]|nr:beta-propeller fold lactonase family protein [Sedimentisphaerales bacterium]
MPLLIFAPDPFISRSFCKTPDVSTELPVGNIGPQQYMTPIHQILTPSGTQVELPGMRPQALALSPDGRLLATSGKTQQLVLIDPHSGTIKQKAELPSSEALAPTDVSSHILKPDPSGQLSYTGLLFSPNGSRIYLSNAKGDIKVFGLTSDGLVKGLFSIALPLANAPRRKEEIPAGLAISQDGRCLYVALNLSNRLAEIDTATGKTLRLWDVGVAPYDVALTGDKAFVSNWGGRRPNDDSITGPAGQGTLVRVDPIRHIACEGSVSVIHLSNKIPITHIPVGLHSSALAVSPDKRYVVVANAGSDTLSVIDTDKEKVVETIWSKSSPADLFGASPNALTFDPQGTRLYVANGTQNAIAVIHFHPGISKMLGLIPVGWFPGAITYDAKREYLYVANIKGVGSTRRLNGALSEEYNSRQYHGTLSLLPIPEPNELPALTRRVLDNYRYPLLKEALQPPRPNQSPRPVPQRVGEPCVFQHAVYIIKENRTYDQVLGDVPQGNGDPSLCIFGERITPNQHEIVRQFVLLDNTYCSGILSADGHQWTDSAFATDYMEKSFAGFPRSYPDGMEDDDVDALAYAPSGFIWDNAIAHGKTLRVYGEFAITETAWKDPARKSPPTFLDYYRDFTQQTNLIQISSRPAIESLRPYLNTKTVGWDMAIPDIFRAKQFIKELHEFENKGRFPNLCIICLPNDHTSGTKAGAPTPAAQVADNDLAFGQIVEAISHSRFWKDTCIFAIEDDPQAGWDHVSGFRTTAYVISPYTKRDTVIKTQYNQTSILRTIELILGLPPMNQIDATATPLSDCFIETPDFSPYVAVPSNIPLDQMNPDPKEITNAALRNDAIASAALPLSEVDQCPEDTLNQILWRAMKGSLEPYPQWAVVPDLDDD